MTEKKGALQVCEAKNESFHQIQIVKPTWPIKIHKVIEVWRYHGIILAHIHLVGHVVMGPMMRCL
jgi:hypothetical protein